MFPQPSIIGNTDLESGFYRIAAFATNRSFIGSQKSLFDLAAFTCATAIEAKNRVLGGARVWRYRYFGDFNNLRLFPGSGAYHGSDLEMVFGTAQDVSGEENSEVENETSAYIMRAWATFARDPVHGLSNELKWPAYSVSDDGEENLIRLGFENQTSASFVSPASSDLQCPALNGSPDLGKGAM
ncbi:carboxylesterase [Phlyctema vagabunda]|uniref:Carboxylesterase n=1 Tax=Phlyctema vagabunda TaxID=108571 RepID=A0ABR4PPY2_9HELO